ncbi:MAG: cation:proton antiporter [Leptospiraceae bacterium]|nr:cation:proton antiporter [Leptospiraceae bacterium]MCK6381266.1 cation:proton antiporter [Leptospiraceae bacterium]NUM40559.1 cation:proton antiporter [Leptospiraceae bacterium]
MRILNLKTNYFAYITMLVVFGFGIFFILKYGKNLESQNTQNFNTKTNNQDSNSINEVQSEKSKSFSFKEIKNLVNLPLPLLLVQVILIILFSRLCGMFFRKIGQPMVIGEILAGILLGPSFFGLVFPELSAIVFSTESLKQLQILSQIGLIFFMFIIGMELDLHQIKAKTEAAIFTSHASVVIPFLLGSFTSIFLFEKYAPRNIYFSSFSLFMGIAMSITAFPVLARIIQERGLIKSKLGTMALTCAAVDDITAWCALAVVVTVVQTGTILTAMTTIVLSMIYIGIMIYFIQPLLSRMGSIYASREILGKGVMSAVLVLLFSSALFTEMIGIHALFGAFLAGVVMPASTKFRKILSDRLEDISMTFLLPLFFVFTGLRTQINLLNESDHWITLLLIISVAVLGKFGGSSIAAKYSGMNWKDSLSLGALMNTRGLMELIILNIGYDLGVLSPSIFTMMVIMAIVTTFMTGPLLTWIQKRNLFPERKKDKLKTIKKKFKITFTFGPSESGISFIKLISGLINRKKKEWAFALHFSPPSDSAIPTENINEREEKFFSPILSLANELDLKVRPVFSISIDVQKDITKYVNQISPNFLFLGAARTIFGDSVTGGKVGEIIRELNCGVGVFIDQGFISTKKILLHYYNPKNDALLEIAGRYYINCESEISILVENPDEDFSKEKLKKFFHYNSKRKKINPIRIIHNNILSSSYIQYYDLTLVDMEYWRVMKNLNNEWMKELNSSILLLKPPKKFYR